jgi:Flp pilus assembly protein TadG
MVEFAFFATLLFLLLFVIIQWGFIFAANITLRNATVVGARYATLVNPKPTQSQIQDVTKNAAAPMLNSGSVTVTVSNVDVGTVTGATSVQASYPLKLILPYAIPGKSLGDTLTLSATTIMR